ncbi:hypothetical protein SLS62_010088 [Diatrype stigma]|uniref:Uncharacterized protein n=1 Tax=Diatrype stigma TaxID=117547 RepID=A0AAN9UBA5_9PEZI
MGRIDTYLGFWATPWADTTSPESAQAGAISVVLQALTDFLKEGDIFMYSQPSVFPKTWSWARHGNSTYPAHAFNAMGGIIAEGTYRGVRLSCFQTEIPVLELLHGSDWQVSPSHNHEDHCEEHNVELMLIDSWLSYVGRTGEITNGPNDLLGSTPVLVQSLYEKLEDRFQDVDLSAEGGGYQRIKRLAGKVMQLLTKLMLSEPEKLYILVAFLRALKVCQCVRAGPSTSGLDQILLNDIQVHLV